jgi:hypothetical protein
MVTKMQRASSRVVNDGFALMNQGDARAAAITAKSDAPSD